MNKTIKATIPEEVKFDIDLPLSGLTLEQAEAIEKFVWRHARFGGSNPRSENPVLFSETIGNNISVELNQHRKPKYGEALWM